jgi:hypothetical protein
MKGKKLNLVKCLETPTEAWDAATSYVSKPSGLSSKLVSMLVDDLERSHVELEFHTVSAGEVASASKRPSSTSTSWMFL